MRNLNDKSYNTVLTECNDFFNNQGISIIGEGYKEIATNAPLFESYVEYLTEGVTSADHAATMAQIMANTNAHILHESSMTGIQPVASLSMPVIRKLWPKFALKDAIPTEVAKSPRFVVAYTAPYMFKGDSQKIYLPRAIRETAMNSAFPAGLSKEYTASKTVTLSAGSAAAVDWSTDSHVNISTSPSAAKLQALDELIFVSAKCVTITTTNEGTENETTTVTPLSEIKIGKRLGVYGNAVYDFVDNQGNAGQLIVQFDGKNRKATFAAIGGAVQLVVKAAVATEYNEESWSISFDVKRQDIDIPTGQHLNAPLPIEALNDLMALYQIDGTKETVDLMTNVFAQKLDLEVLEFLKNSFANQPGNEAFNDGTYGVAGDFTLMFDCKPAAGFAGSPKAWREELKPMIDTLAQKIKNITYLQTGVFTIIANPLDVQILANIDWQFRGGQGGNIDGVDVDYSVGTYVGANAYKVIASTNVPAGAMFLIFAPSSDKQMTYKYYPYTFSTEMGYIDPNRSRTPSIMMTKRHQFHEFLPAIGCILIKNNDGQGLYSQYSTWKEYTSNAQSGAGTGGSD